ncbi:hypothetical protein [Pseudomonas paralcaligenes]|uniref:hypothetical protein n=1 Tax=Pseudomonas paralcaligenes TaxID=2772558 RepID=UPI001C7F70A5|nr:hypothetical protein [Pseudomonas paralcaligenes]
MHIIKGHYRDESGLLEAGELMVEKTENGWRHPESWARLEAARYAVARGIAGVEITSPDSLTEFLPNEGECERIGMEIAGQA